MSVNTCGPAVDPLHVLTQDLRKNEGSKRNSILCFLLELSLIIGLAQMKWL